MRKYTTHELVQLFDKKDWSTLWKIMQPMVKHAVKRCMQEGLDPFYVRDDLMQEAYLAAWEALPRWNAFEAGLQTWVSANVRIAVTDTNRREQSGMIGGRDSGPLVISMHGEEPDDDGSEDEQGVSHAPEAMLTYKDPPEGFGDPSEEVEDLSQALLRHVPDGDRDMVRQLCGIGVPAQTQEEYAQANKTTRKAVERRIARLRNKVGGFSRNPANHVMTARQTRRKAA